MNGNYEDIFIENTSDHEFFQFFKENQSSSNFSVCSNDDFNKIYKTKIMANNNSISSITTNTQEQAAKKRKRKYETIEEKKINKRLMNRVAAKKSRDRKKKEIDKIFKENFELKEKIRMLEWRMSNSICPNCHKKILFSQAQTISESLPSSIQNPQKKVLFTLITAIGLICVLFNIFSGNYFETNTKLMPIRILYERLVPPFNQSKIEIRKSDITKHSFKVTGWFLTFGDFYSITQRKPFLSEEIFEFDNKGKVRMLTVDEAFKLDSCQNCVVQLGGKNIVRIKPLHFNLFMTTDKYWSLSEEDGNRYIYPDSDSDSHHQFFRFNCKIIGVSINSLRRKERE